MKKRFSKAQKKALGLTRKISILLFCLAMAIGTVGGLLFPLRPSTSVMEKRNLTSFPAFSIGSFLSGDWFSQISLWYSDTYPGRETFVAMNNQLSKLKGFKQNEMVIGGNTTADTIGDPIPTDASKDDSKKDGSEDTSMFEKRTAAPELYQLQEDIQGQIMDGLLVKDGRVYFAFYFVQEACDQYTQAINRAAKELEGTTTIYSVIAPCNSSILLDDETYKKLSGSDQKQAIDYYYSQYNDLVKPVGTYDILKEHDTEHVYFTTDHHWTPLGAYYAYVNFCKAKGIEPVNKDDLQKIEFYPFTGSYASMLPTVELEPETFEAWVPNGGNTMKIFTADIGNPNSDQFYEYPVVNTDEAYCDQNNHYMRLIAGDQEFEEIDNKDINDGSSCLVISESYGCAFVPWLVNNYDKVYTMDQRYSDVDFVTFCKENDIDDLIIVNNIQLASSTSLVATIDEKLH